MFLLGYSAFSYLLYFCICTLEPHETQVECILRYVSMTFVSVRSIFIFRYILRLDFRLTITQLMCALPSPRKFTSNHLIMHNFYTSLGRNFIPEEFLKSPLVEPLLVALCWNCPCLLSPTCVSAGCPLPDYCDISSSNNRDNEERHPERNILQEIITNLFLILLSSA